MPVDPSVRLLDDTEILYRQVHPNLVAEGRPSSRAFQPNSGDDGHLSTDRGSVCSARQAYERYLARMRKSAGSWGCTVGEFGAVSLQCYQDPLEENDAHALVDYSGLEDAVIRNKGKKLANWAKERGILYDPA